MAGVLLFHHALGLTGGVRSFAEALRAAGHTVETPDLFDGRTFGAVEEGVAHAQEIGFETVGERATRAAEAAPAEVVYVGFSLGVMSAQRLAQTRPGARGAVLVHSCVDPRHFGGAWPEDVPLQIHLTEGDAWVVPPEEDLEAARRLDETVAGAELFLYPGEGHLFAEEGSPDHDADAARLLRERVLAFLDRVG